MYRKTYVEIDLSAIGHNLKQISNLVGPQKKILLPVKADAYGHGIVEVSHYVEQEGLVHMLGVASLDEGIELRNAGIGLPVLVLGLIIPDEEQVNALIEYDLTQAVADVSSAKLISTVAVKKNKEARIHLKVDTGMGRIGCKKIDAAAFADEITQLPSLYLEGLFTHFPVADEENNRFTNRQIASFKEICTQIEQKGITIPIKHTANSAGMINFPESYFDMVRPGIISYGYLPSSDMENTLNVIPAMTLKSNVVFLKTVPAHTSLCYGLTYTTDKETTIATIAIGYGDGYSRFLSNKGKVVINGSLYPIVGRVSMDQILVDIGDSPVRLNDEVLLFGKSTITADTLAEWIDTIPYEITCSISKRVPKIYIQ